jgi:hypothetical protein
MSDSANVLASFEASCQDSYDTAQRPFFRTEALHFDLMQFIDQLQSLRCLNLAGIYWKLAELFA